MAYCTQQFCVSWTAISNCFSTKSSENPSVRAAALLFVYPINVWIFLGRLHGKVVFITGASSGIGENIALALAKHGVKLAIAARRVDQLERVKRNCIGE